MKRVILMAAAVMAAMTAISASAQESRAEANHSVTVNLTGVDYAYELPVGRTATVIGRVGANFGAAWYPKGGGEWRTGTTIAYGDYWLVSPAVEVEPRWYYGLDRRAANGRATGGNAGNFLSLKAQSVFHQLGYDSDGPRYKLSDRTTFAPTWGMRRVWGGHWTMEFTTGVRFGIDHRYGWWKDGALEHLDINVRFGYSF